MQQRQCTNTLVWPYVVVVTCLFVLSVLAPRFWKSSLPLLGYQQGTGTGKAGSGENKSSAGDSEDRAWWELMARGRPQLADLRDFTAPPNVASVAPPITSRVGIREGSLVELELPSPEHAAPIPPARIVGPPLTPPDVLPVGEAMFAVARQSVVRRPETSTVWPMPSTLVQQFSELKGHASTDRWANSVMECFQRIHGVDSVNSPAVLQQLSILESLASEGATLVRSADSESLRSEILRAVYAIQRRVRLWRGVCQVVSQRMSVTTVSLTDGGGLLRAIQAIESRLAGAEDAAAWRHYLMLDALRGAVGAGDTKLRRQLARRVLARMESPGLDESQKAVLTEPPFAALADELRRCASEPVDYLQLVDELELYEQTRSTDAASRLASYHQALRWSPDRGSRSLAESLDQHYRNANLRVAISVEFMNRLLSAPHSYEEEVHEHLMGAHVRGTSRATARLKINFVPNPHRWEMALEAHGDVASETATTKGPATFYNDGISRYLARKLLIVDQQGIHAEDAEVDADSEIGLNAFETDYDDVPLLRWIARSIALRQLDRRSEQIKLAASAQLEQKAGDRMDQEVRKQISEVEREFRTKWLGPLKSLQLSPLALDLQTTEDEVLVRYRLAGDEQLGSHTPRPQSPANSLLSVQIHESSLNNTLQQLHLEGKRSELRTLYRELADTFERTDIEVPEDIPEGVIVQFADRNAIRLRCDGGRVSVTLCIAELKANRHNVWHQFAVRAYYQPDCTQLDANLVRDGYIELAGQRLNTVDQIKLRGIFSAVLSRNRPFNIINKRISRDPQFADLRVSQFDVHDGWIGVALASQAHVPTSSKADEACRQK